MSGGEEAVGPSQCGVKMAPHRCVPAIQDGDRIRPEHLLAGHGHVSGQHGGATVLERLVEFLPLLLLARR
ncbi:hypothetical protein HRbin30_02414 [bacterium HR30]|nr:hypothetical protein HRbin30_02414 [bacterium HR30]